MEPFDLLACRLVQEAVRFVVIGVWGANYYARSGSTIFLTADRDLFLPPEPANLLRAWETCKALGLELWAGDEPLGEPLDLDLAERVVGVRYVTRARDGRGLEVDLSLVMAGFEFEDVWPERRTFRVEEVEIPVARLSHIVRSKAAAGRDKDRLFLSTHEERLRDLMRED